MQQPQYEESTSIPSGVLDLALAALNMGANRVIVTPSLEVRAWKDDVEINVNDVPEEE